MFGLGIILYILPEFQNSVAIEEPTEKPTEAATSTEEPTEISTVSTQTTVPTEPEGTPRTSDTVAIEQPISTPTSAPTSEVERIPTKTATVTPVSAVGTVTPTLSTSEGDNTPPGTVLDVGETWYIQGVSVEVSDFRFTNSECVNKDDWGEWIVTIENNTDQDLFVGITQEDLFFIDDKGNDAGFYITSHTNCTVFDPPAPGRVNLPALQKDETYVYRVYGLGSLEDRQWFEFGIRDAGRIQNARWRIEIPR
jgi:hypothetical protein